MKKQKDRGGRHRRLLFVWVILAVIMAGAITITSISILTSQVKNDRDKAVAGAAKLAAKEIDAFVRLAEKGELRAPDDVGGGSIEDISNIHKNQ